jgi:hypothetical protein
MHLQTYSLINESQRFGLFVFVYSLVHVLFLKVYCLIACATIIICKSTKRVTQSWVQTKTKKEWKRSCRLHLQVLCGVCGCFAFGAAAAQHDRLAIARAVTRARTPSFVLPTFPHNR